MMKSSAEAIAHLAASTAQKYSSDTIVILGKGPSADQVHSRVFKDAVVIGVNDAERIHPTDITIFYEDWVGESVAEDGLRSAAYVTSTSFHAPDRKVVRLPFRPLSNDAEDQVLLRFQDRSEVAIEEAMFLTALEIARAIADHRDRTQTVYMVGFDFTPDAGQARAAASQYSPELSSRRRAGMELQEYILQNALYTLEDTNLDVRHVGTRDFSDLTPELLNERYHVSVAESPLPEPVDYPDVELPAVEITAEITTNHFGDLDRLEKLVRAAHAAGADWVKVQKRDVNTFYTSEQLKSPYKSPYGSTFGDYRRQLELGKEGFQFLDQLTQDLGIGWFVSVLDQPSFEWMTSELDVPMVKLPSTISEKKEYLEFVAQNYSGSLVVSTGMTDQAYEQWLLKTFTRQDRLYLLHCNSAYPTPDEHTNIGVVRHYAHLAQEQNGHGGPRIIPGYSSHDYGWMASALAVAAGAQMVEKHVKLGHTEWAHFDAVAVDLTTEAFTEYVDAIRQAQLHVGSSQKKITASEHHKY
ncbi:N-acetylneuraminate synthase family protein [Nesterenkonia sphaerica]|uniref:N-acetylneuraminate synthase n=1 Tax=Nesterenkonia sphaerica TaxID=1804988 RepID=A0A5R9ACM7_9MICC|nr:N-acetylneuraminate synthase family protein [Nesterenkonia sphaerica]TLP75586.1 N-acetylneuraminate synthase [Nesterenkonia sphaerica]